ncbi:hypothetical protein [Armatimonas sp.]|uniref:hypothetical protein n=1 Tax=Armatimonas sp. TaxID=1872638 RepID=UPI00374D0357
MDTLTSVAPRKRGALNNDILKSLQTALTIAQAAQREPFVPQLTEMQLSAVFISSLLSDIAECHATLDTAFDADQEVKGSTQAEGTARARLKATIRRIQAAASQKYARDPENKHKLALFGMGINLDASRALLAQHAPGILSHLTDDSLPGLSAAFQEEAAQALTDWTAADSLQAAAQQTATQKRAEAQVQSKAITDRRIQVQYAIEGLYPHTLSENAAARAAFLLPKTRPFRG